MSYKWIFKRKYLPDGSIEKYKARLVTIEFSQKQNIDYFDTLLMLLGFLPFIF